MRLPRRRCAAFSLLELLLVTVILGILMAFAVPSSRPAIYDQLRSTAQIVATDCSYARSLAVANNSTYRITFDLNANRYVLKHAGANTALNQLPKTPFSSPSDLPDQHVVDLDELPRAGPAVYLAAVATSGTTMQSIGNVEFGPLGQTTQADPTTIWLTAGRGSEKRYMTLTVNPATGMIQLGGLTIEGPPSGVTQIP